MTLTLDLDEIQGNSPGYLITGNDSTPKRNVNEHIATCGVYFCVEVVNGGCWWNGVTATNTINSYH